jgi:hypothetical protein
MHYITNNWHHFLKNLEISINRLILTPGTFIIFFKKLDIHSYEIGKIGINYIDNIKYNILHSLCRSRITSYLV